MALSLNQAKTKKKAVKKKAAKKQGTSKKKLPDKKRPSKTRNIQPWQSKKLDSVEKVKTTSESRNSNNIDDDLYEGIDVYPEDYTTNLINELKSLPWQSIRHPRSTAKLYSSKAKKKAYSIIRNYLPKIF